jgi:glycosyltransferase involved in cell wall biosynthesis
MSNKKVKIGIIANRTWNIVNFRLDLIHRLREKGFEPVVLAPEDDHTPQLQKLKIEYSPIKRLSRNGTNPIKDLLLLIELVHLFKKHELDLVLLYTIKPNIYGSIAARWVNISSIATVTGLGYIFLNRKYSGWIAKKLYKAAFRYTNKIVFHNPEDQALFTQSGLAGKNKCLVIPGSGVNMEYFSPVQTGIRSENEKIRFLYIGRLLYDKGVLELLQAFEKLYHEEKEVELWMVGEVDQKNPSAISRTDLKYWERSLDTFDYKGVTDDVRPYIKASDVVVLPSYREGLPKTILEAMAMAKPIIVSDVPGCRETIASEEPKNGYFCKSKDPESLYEQLLNMVRLSKLERDRMGKASRELVREKFQSNKIVIAYEKLIDEILLNVK